ncbi:hypothetical protein HPB50_005061 [Hyalomma asiaticum]|uniref:Uncharacterized protein n=1 Tax=Hyalomma asiaticum TaxID=266040 RepID=A0ACB7SN03_HYAAI|nr:hypothetical protein HPB50_005061 [Hyalomma asiaticum]
MVLKRYRTAVTIAVIGAMSCVGTVLFALTVRRDRHPPAATDCNSTSCRQSHTEAPAIFRSGEATQCRSFYDYVCSMHSDSRPKLHQQAALALVTKVNASLFSFSALSEAFMRGSCPSHHALLGLDLYRACVGGSSAPTDWEQVARLLRRLGLAGWPLAKARPLDRSPWDLAGVLDFNLGVFPLARLSLRRHYGRVTLQLDRTALPLRIHQLSVPPPSDLGSYLRIVESALGMLQDGGRTTDKDARLYRSAAAAIVELEHALERAQPHDAFVYGARLMRLGELPRSRQWDWAEYIAIVRDDSTLLTRANLTLLVHEPEQFALATSILGNTSAAVLFNYLGYRTLTHIAPLLPTEAHFLLPLAPWADAGPSPLLAGCLRLLAQVHPQALPFFANVKQGETEDDPPSRSSVDTLFYTVQRATAAVVETLPWRKKGFGLRRARTVVETRLLLGEGTRNTSSQNECVRGSPTFRSSKGGTLEALLRVQSARSNAFWLADSPSDGLDSRHQIEPFSMRADYFTEPNVVYASPALSMALGDRPFGAVQSAVPLVEALLRAALPGEPHELLRIPTSQIRCLAHHLGISPYDGHMPDQLRELFQPSVLMQMLLRPHNESAVVPPVWKQWKMAERELVYVHWALTLCDSSLLHRRLRRYKTVPARQRIDVTLSNHAAFHKTWHCPPDTAMHRNKACPPLTA